MIRWSAVGLRQRKNYGKAAPMLTPDQCWVMHQLQLPLLSGMS